MTEFNRDLYADEKGITHIVKGAVTCLDAHPEASLGDPEWQFSNGPPGSRGCSTDYTDLAEGLRDFTGRKVVFHADGDV